MYIYKKSFQTIYFFLAVFFLILKTPVQNEEAKNEEAKLRLWLLRPL